MATRIGNTAKNPGGGTSQGGADSSAEAGNEELEILMGEGQVKVADRQLSVREYTFAEAF